MKLALAVLALLLASSLAHDSQERTTRVTQRTGGGPVARASVSVSSEDQPAPEEGTEEPVEVEGTDEPVEVEGAEEGAEVEEGAGEGAEVEEATDEGAEAAEGAGEGAEEGAEEEENAGEGAEAAEGADEGAEEEENAGEGAEAAEGAGEGADEGAEVEEGTDEPAAEGDTAQDGVPDRGAVPCFYWDAECTSSYGVDFPGNDVAIIRTNNTADCCSRCKETEGCLHWVARRTHDGGYVCHLKSIYGFPTYCDECTFSYTKSEACKSFCETTCHNLDQFGPAVCGTDGYTYESPCQMQCTGVSLADNGECDSPFRPSDPHN